MISFNDIGTSNDTIKDKTYRPSISPRSKKLATSKLKDRLKVTYDLLKCLKDFNGSYADLLIN